MNNEHTTILEPTETAGAVMTAVQETATEISTDAFAGSDYLWFDCSGDTL